MKRKKRFISIALTFALAIGLSGCNHSESTSSTGQNTSSEEALPKVVGVDALLDGSGFITGGTVGDYVARGVVANGTWSAGAGTFMKNIRKSGMDWVRVIATTGDIAKMDEIPSSEWPGQITWTDDVWCCKQYAGYILQDAQKNDINKILCLYLGDDGTSYSGRQPVSKLWKDPNGPEVADAKDAKPLPLEKSLPIIKEYVKGVAQYYKDKGISIELYEIGNEIEYGIAGYFHDNQNWAPEPQAGENRSSVSYLKREVWPVEAQVIRTVIEGIREVDADAKFTLHTASVAYVPMVRGFFEYMVKEAKIDFDVIGVSYYWNEANQGQAPYFTNPELKETTDFLKALGKTVIFSEFAYPAAQRGELASYRGVAHTGYPYTEDGQKKYIDDFLNWAKNEAKVGGALYFYPDYFEGAVNAEWGFVLEDCGLFNSAWEPKDALSVFQKY